jgi:drug/metabolite transporter (DMT)-like permease
VLLAVGFGVVASFLFASSASLQQHAAHREVYQARAADGRGAAGNRAVVVVALFQLLRRLVRNPLWLVGWLTNLVGFLVQAAALHFGSVALVQPLLVTQLIFALPLASAWRRKWPQKRDWFSGSLICAGLIVFLAVRGVAPLESAANRHRLLYCLGAAFVLVVSLVWASAGRRPLVHASLIAVAAGLCFAVSAAMIKLTTEDLIKHGVAATARDWPGYALAASTWTGLVLEQGAFAAGSLPTAVAAMTITNPVASYLLGVLAFGAVPPTGLGPLAALAGAGALISAGAIGLAHSPIVRREVVAVDTG